MTPALFLLLTLAPADGGDDGLRLRSSWLETTSLPDLGRALPEGRPGFDVKKGKRKPRKRGKDYDEEKSSSLEYGALSGHSAPMDKVLGLGMQVGAPTGVTLKVMPHEQIGIVGTVGAFSGWVLAPTLTASVDLVFHPHVLARADSFRLSWYVGGGLAASIAPLTVLRPWYSAGNDELYFGFNYMAGIFRLPWYGGSLAARVPFGLSLALNELPIEVYMQAVPALLVFPALGGGIGGSIGARFWL